VNGPVPVKKDTQRQAHPVVTFVCDVFYPSSESTSQLFTELFNKLAADGLNVRVISNRLPGLDHLLAKARPLHQGVTVTRVGLSARGRSSIALRILRYTVFMTGASVRLLFSKTDRFWGSTNPPFTPIWLAAIAAIRRKPFDIIIHDLYPDGLVAVGFLSAKSPFTTIWHRFNQWAYRRAAKVVVLGRDMAHLVRHNYNVPESRIILFPNWSPFDQQAPPEINDSLLAEALALKGRFVVQYSGNMGLWHDIDTFVRAAELLSANDRVHFLMIGEGRRRDAAQALAKRLGLNNITWLDFQARETLPDSLACASVALISQREGLEGIAVPCKLYGILASGRPIVAAVPVASEVARVVTEEECGIVVSPSDPVAVAAAIRRLAEDRELTSAMGKRAFCAYKSNYSLNAAAERFWRQWGAPDGLQ
jgi:colanic acid biosynthesis glycosyl transferase WcaI